MTQTWVGDQVTLTAAFRDQLGTLTNPTTTTLTVTDPDGTTTTPTLTTPQTGVRTATITATKPGRWHWRFTATGAVVDTQTGELWVTPQPIQQPAATAITPTVEEVAQLLSDHTSDQYGARLRTFTADTVPTAFEATAAIARAERIVRGLLGAALTSTTVPTQAPPLARDTIAVLAALHLAMYLPTPEPEYERLQQQYDRLIGATRGVLEGQVAATAPWAVVPVTTVTRQYSDELGLYEA